MGSISAILPTGPFSSVILPEIRERMIINDCRLSESKSAVLCEVLL